ncbi:MAG: hypothetical protein AAF928_14595 [Myxococcota bacterium]
MKRFLTVLVGLSSIVALGCGNEADGAGARASAEQKRMPVAPPKRDSLERPKEPAAKPPGLKPAKMDAPAKKARMGLSVAEMTIANAADPTKTVTLDSKGKVTVGARTLSLADREIRDEKGDWIVRLVGDGRVEARASVEAKSVAVGKVSGSVLETETGKLLLSEEGKLLRVADKGEKPEPVAGIDVVGGDQAPETALLLAMLVVMPPEGFSTAKVIATDGDAPSAAGDGDTSDRAGRADGVAKPDGGAATPPAADAVAPAGSPSAAVPKMDARPGSTPPAERDGSPSGVE